MVKVGLNLPTADPHISAPTHQNAVTEGATCSQRAGHYDKSSGTYLHVFGIFRPKFKRPGGEIQSQSAVFAVLTIYMHKCPGLNAAPRSAHCENHGAATRGATGLEWGVKSCRGFTGAALVVREAALAPAHPQKR